MHSEIPQLATEYVMQDLMYTHILIELFSKKAVWEGLNPLRKLLLKGKYLHDYSHLQPSKVLILMEE